MRFRSAPAALARFCVAVLSMLSPPQETAALQGRHDRPGSDRGDVPGWVMITVMTAVVVLVLIGVFQGAVVDAVKNAFSSISDTLG